MADGPNFDTNLVYRMQQAQAQGGSGSAPILLGARLDTNVGTGLSLKGRGFNADGMILQAPQRAPGPVAGLLRQMGLVGPEILEGLKKVAQAGPVQQASITDITGQSHGLGGGFAGSVSASSVDTDKGIA